MLRHNTWRAVLVGATMTALSVFGTGAASAAGAQTASIACHTDGYVCITTNDLYEPTVLIPEGEDYTFLRATEVTSISNDTTGTYCVEAEYNFTVSAGESVEAAHTVTRLEASPDGHCLS
ncbi:hypothetical protein [Streptomyces sp. AcE210]|uniref:hypothetical protein n=1 Tax=Streptomyces sp. AcE210 TaxID=2292703 RepID=UPI000E303316|nr:hypothetical protein [Streptomyces sp. AcE210]RFC76025.1 hypothetical protein DXZ75_16435 [Streptomyces sp. AcE210]